jgi:endo-1,4-beta-D-glucanase Y
VRLLTRATSCLIVVVLLADLGVVVHDGGGAWTSEGATEARPDPAVAEARAFLDRYVEPDGRVVRHDQGGDTVSEGQAYAMLLAVVADDRHTFALVWGWARAHLERDDGLLAWRWADGHVVDDQPAADADLDAAWALALAERRWPDGDYAERAEVLAHGVEAHESSTLPDGRPVLLPGPWARARADDGDGVVLNPSYSSPVGEHVLVAAGHLQGDPSRARRATMRAVVTALLDRGDLPSDWVLAASDGGLRRVAGPEDDEGGRFGWDAVRIPLRMAASCDGADRAVAARLERPLREGAGSQAMGDHPARWVAAAAATAAAGYDEEAADLLDRASRAQAGAPTYYGGALVALALALLTTDQLGGCPPA